MSVWALFLKLKWIFVLVSSTEINDSFLKENLAVTVTAHVARQNNSTIISDKNESRETTANAAAVFLSFF